jgi:predicted HNH restriction endonuclease
MEKQEKAKIDNINQEGLAMVRSLSKKSNSELKADSHYTNMDDKEQKAFRTLSLAVASKRINIDDLLFQETHDGFMRGIQQLTTESAKLKAMREAIRNQEKKVNSTLDNLEMFNIIYEKICSDVRNTEGIIQVLAEADRTVRDNQVFTANLIAKMQITASASDSDSDSDSDCDSLDD